ncbi:hypothetical protein CCMA1212_009847 [Trichoderma ghanense]|uniref:Uncharacterized protein n=1 Tax=Trichoderma ghanense TaxID=65468 RepID=A0ABY2GRT6_9HYPO
MKFTATTIISLLTSTALAAPTDLSSNSTTTAMVPEASPPTELHLADIFSDRQAAVLKVLSSHKQDLGLSEKEAEILDTFMKALRDNVSINVKRQLPPVSPPPADGTNTTTPTTPTDGTGAAGGSTPVQGNGTLVDPLNGVNVTALGGLLGSAPLNGVNVTALGSLLGNATGTAATANATATALAILGAIPGLASLLGGTTTGGLGGLTAGLGGLTGLGGLNGGMSGLTGGLGGLLGGLRRGGLLGGILIPGIL